MDTPTVELLDEFREALNAELDARGLARVLQRSPKGDAYHYRFPAAGIIPGVTGAVPGARFKANDDYRPHSEVMFTRTTRPTFHDWLIQMKPVLQELYGNADCIDVWTPPHGTEQSKIYVRVVRDGRPDHKEQWPDLVDWFINSQLGLLTALRAIFSTKTDTAAAATAAYEGLVEVDAVRVDTVPLAVLNAELYEVREIAARTGGQPERELCDRFAQYLGVPQHERKRHHVVFAGGAHMWTDLVNHSGNILFEAKSSESRMAVRLALGQLLDYAHHLGPTVSGHLRLAVLLPRKPAADLIRLLGNLGIGCICEGPTGTFQDETGLGLCR